MSRYPGKHIKPIVLTILAVLAAVLAVGCAQPEPTEPAAAEVVAASSPSFGIEPEVSINAVMVGLVDHAAHHLWDLGREGAAPQDEGDWLEVEHHAIQLAAGAAFIATGGAGQPDPGWVNQLPWKGWAEDVSAGATRALEGARARDLETVLDAGDDIIEACEGCHKEFKPELPTEGIVHPHIYEPRVD